jgi:hypothetical protein
LRPTSPESDLLTDATTTIARYLPAIRFDDVTHPTRFHCHTKVASRYRSNRILLAGDAAHVCSPSQGHGMNSGLQDAFNLAWKLALVCHGQSKDALLDSYEVERRPVAKMITASGEEFEKAQDITDPAQRRARDNALRATFTDSKSRHHESIAEAELDIDYCSSPIVMGDKHDALTPGHRIPDTIQVTLADGAGCLLHELAHRPGHTALVLGGSSTPSADLIQLEKTIRATDGAIAVKRHFVEHSVALTLHPNDHNSCARLAPSANDQLGIGDFTLLVVRPDGHIGLRADRNHQQALAAYNALLASGARK